MHITPQRWRKELSAQRLTHHLVPRNVHQARWAGIVTLVTPAAALVLIGVVQILMGNGITRHSPFSDPTASVLYTVILPTMFAISALIIRVLPDHIFTWLALPLTVACVGLQTWVSWSPASTSEHQNAGVGQVLFLVPVLFAAYALQRFAMWLILALTIIANATLLGISPKTTVYVIDWLTLSVMALAMALPIARSRDQAAQLRAGLARQAALDGLTGLLNRQSFDRAITDVEQSPCPGAPGVGLILLDVDHFKNLNDEHGHPVGDAVLCELAVVLRHEVAAIQGGTAYRLGGDELVMLLPNTDEDTVTTTAMNVVARAAEIRVPGNDGHAVPITASVGLAHWPTHTANIEHIYSVADSGLYAAKRSGRNAHRAGQADDQPTSKDLHQPFVRGNYDRGFDQALEAVSRPASTATGTRKPAIVERLLRTVPGTGPR